MDIEKLWQAVLEQNADELRKFFHPDAIVNWHNTNERFTVEEYIRANCEYPGEWMGKIERVVKAGDMIVTATRVYSKNGDVSVHAASFIEVVNGKIASMDEYWGDDGEPPAWRKAMKIGSRMTK